MLVVEHKFATICDSCILNVSCVFYNIYTSYCLHMLYVGNQLQYVNQVVTCNTIQGFYCVNSQQVTGQCFDYKVRFLCPCTS